MADKNSHIAVAGTAVVGLLVAGAVAGTNAPPSTSTMFTVAPVPNVNAVERARAPELPVGEPIGPNPAPFTTQERMDAWKALGVRGRQAAARRCHGVREETMSCLLPGVP